MLTVWTEQAALEAGLSKEQALALASTNLETLLGVDAGATELGELVATEGGELFGMESKVAAVISPRRGVVDMF